MKKRLLSLTLIAALCLSLFPTGAAPALAVDGDTVYVGGVALTGSEENPAYATTDDSGAVIAGSASENNYNIKWDGSTLTLNDAYITEYVNDGSSAINGTAIGVANSSGNAELTIQLDGTNTVSASTGVHVYSSSGTACLTITGENGGSLKASGNMNGIKVQSNRGDATLKVNDAKVTATSESGIGVSVQVGISSDASLTVKGGSLTASGRKGILFPEGTPQLTVDNSTIVRASGGIASGTNENEPVATEGTGIVFNDKVGTVYGNATLQEDLTIGEDERLTLAENASLSADGYNVIVDGGTLDDSIKNSLGDSVKYTPTITTATLTDGRVGEPYSASLGADGTTPITWSITTGSLPAGLSLNGNTISGTPTTAGASTFTVTATNTVGSDNRVATDSKELSITISPAQDITPPTLTAGSTTRTGEATATVTFTSNEAGSYYYAIVEHDAIAPTIDTNGTGTPCDTNAQTISLNNLSGASAKDIYIVVKDAANNVSQPLKMEIPAYVAPSYSISATPAALNFGSIDDGHAAPAAQTVTITNTGNRNVTVKLPTSTNYTITAGTGFTNGTVMLAPNATATFTVQPKTGLSAGTYNETLTISGSDSASAEIALTFTVNKRPYTGKYSYEIVSDVGENGTIDVDRYATEGDQVTITISPDEAYLPDDLTVTSGGRDVELTANSDGTYSFTMPSADVKITATFAEDPDWTPDEPEEPTTDVSDIFIDVAPNAWYKDAVQYAYAGGLMTGVSDTEFAPEATTTRAMIVSILARLENVTTAQAAGFADVDDEWYATAVNWAANVGVVNGYEDNTFQPNTAITREQLAAILMNYAACIGQDVSNRADLTSYTDQPSAWANEAMQWAVAEGLFSGVTNDELQPQASATRAQVAAILQRFLAQ